MVTKKQVENTKQELSSQNRLYSLQHVISNLPRFIREYVFTLGLEFNELVNEHRKIAYNGFIKKSSVEKLKNISQVKPKVYEIADLENRYHPCKGLIGELAQEIFSEIIGTYKQVIRENNALALSA